MSAAYTFAEWLFIGAFFTSCAILYFLAKAKQALKSTHPSVGQGIARGLVKLMFPWS